MSGTSFNGYHVWLGIPPDEQPPNHYRLLGISPFETDLDVIEHAADRQMAHVRTFQSGRNAALSQQILNELAAARVCLLTPDKKTAYDRDLRSKLGKGAAAVPVGKPVPVAKAVPLAKPVAKTEHRELLDESADEIGIDLDTFPSSMPSGAPAYHIQVKRRKYKQSGGKNTAVLGALMAVVIIGALCLFYFVRHFLSSDDLRNAIFGPPGNAAPAPGGILPGGPPAPAQQSAPR